MEKFFASLYVNPFSNALLIKFDLNQSFLKGGKNSLSL